jgi:hypothetical protein
MDKMVSAYKNKQSKNGENNMSTKFLKVFGAIAAVAILALGLLAFTQPGIVSAAALDRQSPTGSRGGYGQGTGTINPGSGIALTSLSADEKDALNQAILEEYGALNLYQSVIAQFGNVYPFSQIVRSEQQHINALTRQAVKYGVTVPANPGLASPTDFASLSEACQAGVAAEIADAALYDELKPVVTHTDILSVFNNLQSASLNSHLPAFQACQ